MGKAASRELERHLPAPEPERSSYYPLGRVQVLRVGGSLAAAFGGPRTIQHLQLFRKASSWGPLIRAAPVLLVALVEFGLDLVSRGRIAPDTVLLVGSLFVGHLFARVLTVAKLERRWSFVATIIAASSLLALLIASRSESISGWYEPSLILALVGLATVGFAAVDLWLPTGWAGRTTDRHARVSAVDLGAMMLGASPTTPGIAVGGLPAGRVVIGPAAPKLLVRAAADLWGEVRREDVEAGWVLARSSGSLHNLIRTLDEARPDFAGAHRWATLPHSWKMAFYLCAIEHTGTNEEQTDLLDRIRSESEVAAIAEQLDQELGITGD